MVPRSRGGKMGRIRNKTCDRFDLYCQTRIVSVSDFQILFASTVKRLGIWRVQSGISSEPLGEIRVGDEGFAEGN